MAGLVLFILILIILALAVVCIQRQTKILSLKREIAFLELTLRQFAEKEKASDRGVEEDEALKGTTTASEDDSHQ